MVLSHNRLGQNKLATQELIDALINHASSDALALRLQKLMRENTTQGTRELYHKLCAAQPFHGHNLVTQHANVITREKSLITEVQCNKIVALQEGGTAKVSIYREADEQPNSLTKVREHVVAHGEVVQLKQGIDFYLIEYQKPTLVYFVEEPSYLPVQRFFDLNGCLKSTRASRLINSRQQFLCRVIASAGLTNLTPVLKELIDNPCYFVSWEAFIAIKQLAPENTKLHQDLLDRLIARNDYALNQLIKNV